MPLTNYRDISTPIGDVGAGFQFEFACEVCGDTWKTPFQPYRSGQAAGIFRRFAGLINEFYKIGAVTDMISKAGRASGISVEAAGGKFKNTALVEALALAEKRYEKCASCKKQVCANCFDEQSGQCNQCHGGAQGASAQAGVSASSAVCPSCQTPSQGGRFCHECGFDMASTHKSCPTCGVTMSRQARFCTDCGHGF